MTCSDNHILSTVYLPTIIVPDSHSDNASDEYVELMMVLLDQPDLKPSRSLQLFVVYC